MTVHETDLRGVLLLAPKTFADSRGFFFESYNFERYRDAGVLPVFIQDNVSYSGPGVIRGLHYQFPNSQAKLIQVLEGAVLDVVVDIRRGSPTFGRWISKELSSENHHQLYIPEGFAHGFEVVGAHALVSYKCSSPYNPATEGTIRWDDPAVGIKWRSPDPIVSEKDRAGITLADMPESRLPLY